MKFVVISSGLDNNSRSRRLARLCHEELRNASATSELVDLAEYNPPNFDNSSIFESTVYRDLYDKVDEADGLVFASPVYNWGCCAELKKFIEYIGALPDVEPPRRALFDKVVTFVNAAGLPHSYMASAALSASLMLDFKCIINPYNVYVHNEHWSETEELKEKAQRRISKSMKVLIELTALLDKRTYQSYWEI